MVFQKQKRIDFSKNKKEWSKGRDCAIVVGIFSPRKIEWLGYWSIVHLPSLFLVLNFVCSLGQGEILSCDPLANLCTFLCIDLFLFDEWYHVAAFLKLMCLCCQAIGWA